MCLQRHWLLLTYTYIRTFLRQTSRFKNSTWNHWIIFKPCFTSYQSPLTWWLWLRNHPLIIWILHGNPGFTHVIAGPEVFTWQPVSFCGMSYYSSPTPLRNRKSFERPEFIVSVHTQPRKVGSHLWRSMIDYIICQSVKCCHSQDWLLITNSVACFSWGYGVFVKDDKKWNSHDSTVFSYFYFIPALLL